MAQARSETPKPVSGRGRSGRSLRWTDMDRKVEAMLSVSLDAGFRQKLIIL